MADKNIHFSFYLYFNFVLSIAYLTVMSSTQDIQQLDATAGDDVTLPCSVSFDYPVWFGPDLFNGYTQQYNNNGQSSFPNPKVPEQKRLRLEWGSDKSSLIIRSVILSDQGLYQCGTVSKVNISVRVPPRFPIILNTETSADGVIIIRLSESQETSLVCISSGGYPQPLVEWYRGNIGTKPLSSFATVTTGDESYNVTQTYIFSPHRQDDRIKYICKSSFKTAPRHMSTSHAELFINLKPNQPTVSQTLIVPAGHQTITRCTTTGSRPAPNITWSYQNTTPPGEQTVTLDEDTNTYTVISLLKFNVSTGDNKQTVQCKVTHVSLVNPAQLTASVILNVTYPPIVSVIATNTTVKASNAILICVAKGNPDSNIRYVKWTQRWPNYDIPVAELPGSETLNLNALTYEHSGYYTCKASNGIKEFGSDTEFIEGTGVLFMVESFPIIVNLHDTLASKLNSDLTVHVEYFSNVAPSEVKLYKNVNDEKKDIVYTVTKNPVEVDVPVFSHLIKVNGTKAVIVMKIKTEMDYGSYIVVVSNDIGSYNNSFEVIRTTPPSTPSDFTINYIQHNKARLSWTRGYNGGLTQTFVVQLGRNGKTWNDVEVFDRVTEQLSSISTILTNLQDSTRYFVRVYSYNEAGNSPLSETLNFTTSSIKVKMTYKTNNTSVIIIGVVLGLIIVVLALHSVIVTVQRRREHMQTQGTSRSKKYENVVSLMKVGRRDKKEENISTDVQASEGQYTELDKDMREVDSAYDAISTM